MLNSQALQVFLILTCSFNLNGEESVSVES